MKILDPSELTPHERRMLLAGEGLYGFPARTPDGRLACVGQLMFTFAILLELTDFGYEDRWCYMSQGAAVRALLAWSGEDGTEPQGWHKHPPSGRIREHGDPAKETVNY